MTTTMVAPCTRAVEPWGVEGDGCGQRAVLTQNLVRARASR
jgi:hypothetical protein